MEACSTTGSPAFNLIGTAALFLLVAKARFWPGIKDLSATIYYTASTIIVASLGWYLSLKACDPDFSLLARIRLVGLNTVIVLSVAAVLIRLRQRQDRTKR